LKTHIHAIDLAPLLGEVKAKKGIQNDPAL
jgi:hypothetical protein